MLIKRKGISLCCMEIFIKFNILFRIIKSKNTVSVDDQKMTMICSSSILAHLVKLFVTFCCMRILNNTYDKTSIWSFRAFQILLSHAIVGAFRFGKNIFCDN